MATAAIRPVAIKIDDDTKAQVKRMAEMRHRTTRWLMGEAIMQLLASCRERLAPCKCATPSTIGLKTDAD